MIVAASKVVIAVEYPALWGNGRATLDDTITSAAKYGPPGHDGAATEGRLVGRSSTAEIADGAGWPAVELVADVRETAHRLKAAIIVLPAEAWERPHPRDVSGADRPARTTVFSRGREGGDRVARRPGRGVAPPPGRPARQAHRPRHLLAWTIGRAEAPELGPW